MSSNENIVSLDIGTSKVRVIIGEVNNGVMNIVGVGSADSEGIRKGAIVDIEQTVQSIRSAIDHAERMVGVSISNVYVGIYGNHIALQSSHGVVAVSNENREIGQEDINRVRQASKVIALPPEREIIDVVPKQYVVDGLEEIHDPRGMIGVRLEVEATIITGAKTAIHNLVKVVEKSGLNVNELILTPLAASQLALSRDERSMGTVLIDIGAGATTISVYDQGNLVALSTLPIGGDLITNDISIGLRTNTETAEMIKLKYGCALIRDADEQLTFKVSRIGSNIEKQYTQSDLATIIEPRIEEIFHLITMEMDKMGSKDVAGGYVLTGGTVSMPGLLEIAQHQLDASVRIAIPDFVGVRDPSFTNSVGIIQYVVKYAKMQSSNNGYPKKANPVKRQDSEQGSEGFFQKLKNWFKEFI